MKLSVLDLVPVFSGVSTVFALEQAVILAQTAEQCGYHRYWVAEHHDMDGLACTAPEVLLAHIGAKTSRIRLGSGAILLPHYKPIKVAETFHMLATLYPGRIDLGIGRAPGGSAHVSIALSGNFLEHVWQLPESLRDLTDLLTHNYQIDGNAITARPIPPTPPEVWLLGTNIKSAAYAAEFGTGYVFGQFMSERDGVEVLTTYKEAFKASRLSQQPRAIVAIGVICAESEAQAQSIAAHTKVWPKSEELPAAEIPVVKRKILIGNPKQVKSQLEELSVIYNTDEFLIVTMGQDYKSRLQSYKLLAQ
jgi:luciferase family oxidoreductase group 1